MMANSKILSVLVFGLAACASAISIGLGRNEKRQLEVPIVDLGYEVHEGVVNATGNYYIFNNIPYAEQPLGDLRFQKPVAIKDPGSGINNGTTDEGSIVICPQAYPQWVINNMAAHSGVDPATMAALLNNQTGQTEACLVLDVYVPTDIFNRGAEAEAPVLVWIHGGGFTFGSKTFFGNPAGLISRSRRNGEDGLIIVTVNYRLGMFGWLAGDDVTPNLGLHDQRLALEWVQQYIHLFGGSAEKVTAMGESAGASSVVHQITAYGGKQPAPFRAAIPQSPAFQFNIDLDASYAHALAEASTQVGSDVKGVAALRGLPTEQLIAINRGAVGSAPVGTFGFGPGPDGSFVPAIPQVLLYEGKFDRNVNLLISHTSNESIPFMPPNITTAADVLAYVQSAFPEASNTTTETLLSDPALYPDVLTGAYPWTTEFGRAARLVAEINFACTARLLALAHGSGSAYAYVFSYTPGWHAGDVPYVFFNGDTTTLENGVPVDGALAVQLQDYIVSFAMTGSPNAEGAGLQFPVYGEGARVLELGDGGFREGEDDLRGGRCEWLQKAMVDGRL